MTSNEMVIVARLADHYDNNLTLDQDGLDSLDVAARDFKKFKRDASELWARLHKSSLSDRKIGDWLYEFFVRHQHSGMTVKNFAAEELEHFRG